MNATLRLGRSWGRIIVEQLEVRLRNLVTYATYVLCDLRPMRPCDLCNLYDLWDLCDLYDLWDLFDFVTCATWFGLWKWHKSFLDFSGVSRLPNRL